MEVAPSPNLHEYGSGLVPPTRTVENVTDLPEVGELDEELTVNERRGLTINANESAQTTPAWSVRATVTLRHRQRWGGTWRCRPQSFDLQAESTRTRTGAFRRILTRRGWRSHPHQQPPGPRSLGRSIPGST